MSKSVKQIIDTTKRLMGERSQLNMLWEEVAEVLAPERIGFINATTDVTRQTDNIFDTQPIVVKRGLVNALGAMLRPKSAAPGKWFDIVPDDDKLLDTRGVKEWIEFVEERLWKALYNPKAKFIEATGEIDDDLVTFGTGVGFIGVRPDRGGLSFRSFHLKAIYAETDGENNITSVYVIERMTAEQASDRWGEKLLGAKTLEALHELNRQGATKKFDFFWCVTPRHVFDLRSNLNTDMAFQSAVVDVESEHLVIEEGFEEFPFFLPRWDTRSGEVYGRGPGILALPDVLTLNQMGKTMLRGLHRAVDPPWLLPSDSMVSAPQMRPGGVAYYDAKAIRNLGVSDPFKQMESRGNIPWGLDAQAALREQLQALFYRNVLNLPVSAPQMTATEVIQRREEFVREIGAVFGRLESDYTGPLVERAFNIMLRRGAFGDDSTIPEEIQKGGVTFRFASPVEKAKRQIEEATVMQGVDKVLAIGQIQPKIMQRFNWDEIGKFIAESGDFPQQLTLDDAAVEAAMEAQAAAEAEEKQMQQAERIAGAAGALPPELLSGAGSAAAGPVG
jgi:hypothetical protein